MNAPDPRFPIFVLCAALYTTDDYLSHDLPALSRLKFQHWWHDAVVFHSYKIRKKTAQFSILSDAEKAGEFMLGISEFFEKSPVTLIAAAIDKPKHKRQYRDPAHPYNMALQFIQERIFLHIQRHLKPDEQVMFVFEKRGRTEDALLREKFELFNERNACNATFPFTLSFAGKEENISGLQVADLAAYPIARYVETRRADRRDWQSILPRIRKRPDGAIDGWGLKIFP